MLKTKVYQTYYPYKENEGKGIEYCFDNDEEEVIDYTNYYHSSFDLFWSNLESRFNLYRTYKNENAQMPSKMKFQDALIDIYAKQYEQKDMNLYFYYVDMNTENFYNKVLEKEESDYLDLETLKFLINQNQYLKQISGTTDYEIAVYDQTEDIYKDVCFYMGVDAFDDVNAINNSSNIEDKSVKLFHYYEFKKKKKKIQHKIISLRIDAPIGTSFYLNRILHPLTVYKYSNPFILDNLKGYYEILPEDYITLKYLTFPKDAIPQYPKVLNENYDPTVAGSSSTRNSNNDDFYLTVSYLYDDDYDVEYQEE